MTAVDTAVVTDQPIPAQRQAAARNAYRASLADGVPLTGAELGRRFGLSPRWGRARAAEVHAEATAGGHGTYPPPGRSLRTSPPDPEHAPRGTGLERRQADVEDRAEAAVSMGDHSEPRSRGRAVSEQRAGEAPSGVTTAVHSITTLAVLAVALVAAVASYDHQRALAELAGEGWRAWLLPVSVTASSWPRPCPCSCGAEPTYGRARSLGHPCSPGSARASPRRSPWLTPRWWGASLRPGPPLPCSSPGSC
jgi:hypothetical protein